MYLRAGKRLVLEACNTDVDTLERLRKTLGGAFWKVSKRQPHWKDAWVWNMSGQSAAVAIRTLYPWFCDRRRRKADEVLAVWDERHQRTLLARKRASEKRATIHSLAQSGRISQAEVSRQVGCSRSYVGRVLRGDCSSAVES